MKKLMWKQEEQAMKKARKAGIVICFILLGIGCIANGCARRREEQERQEELIAGYPDQIKAYLEEKYGREFCVASDWKDWGGSGNPIPFAQPDYITYEYLAWENEEDGYAFWTKVYPVSLKDMSVREIKDNYCWKFISGKIKEELKARLEGIIDDYKIVIYPFNWDEVQFGKEIKEDTEMKEALLASDIATSIYIWVFISPELQFDEGESQAEIEKIVEDFYKEYFRAGTHRIEFSIRETYTKEDYLKIEPEKTEQYYAYVKEPEYENGARIPVDFVDKIVIKCR